MHRTKGSYRPQFSHTKAGSRHLKAAVIVPCLVSFLPFHPEVDGDKQGADMIVAAMTAPSVEISVCMLIIKAAIVPMRIWADEVEKAVVKETVNLDHRRLALGYGEPAFRLGGPPAKMLVATGPLEGDGLKEFNRRQKVINSRVIALGGADD